MDDTLRQSLLKFLKRVSGQYASDADLAIVLRGGRAARTTFGIKLAFSDLSFELLLETGILIQATPLCEDEWEHPSLAPDPSLRRNIRQEGIPLSIGTTSLT